MIFTETKLKGAFVVEPERLSDERGFFARSWSAREFAARGIESRLVECNISFNKKKGTLRGMHFQKAPHGQAKLVRCTMGAIYDVIIDLRPASQTFRQWIAAELTAANGRMLFVPEEFAHGFQTLEDNTEVFYQMSEIYVPESARGTKWNDPMFGIEWPMPYSVISEKDRTYAHLEAQMLEGERVRLREFQADSDLRTLLEIRNNIELQRQLMAVAKPNTREAVIEWIKRRSSNDSVFFVIAEKLNNSCVGFVQLSHIDQLNGKAELGICLHKDYHKKGYGIESLHLLANYSLQVLSLKKILLFVLISNSAAIASYTNSGFREVGILKDHFYQGGSSYDVVLMEKMLAA